MELEAVGGGTRKPTQLKAQVAFLTGRAIPGGMLAPVSMSSPSLDLSKQS